MFHNTISSLHFLYLGSLMSQMLTLLKKRDITLWLKLEEQDLKPQFYAFRWLTLLLSQEFPLPGIVLSSAPSVCLCS